MWRTVLIALPARLVDVVLYDVYPVLLAAGAIICFLTAALWALAAVLRVPLP